MNELNRSSKHKYSDSSICGAQRKNRNVSP